MPFMIVTCCFKEIPLTMFCSNNANYMGGSVNSYYNNFIFFKENSITIFNDNSADYKGGAITFFGSCYTSFEGNSITIFSDNSAGYEGGAINFYDSSFTTFAGNSITEFNNNTADYGHAIHSQINSYISFEGNSAIVYSNTKNCGKAVFSDYKSTRFCKGKSSGDFTYDAANYRRNILSKNNILTIGATILCTHNSKIIVKGHSTIIFNDSLVKWCEGACLPYRGENDAVMIDVNGIVWCSYPKQFNCLSDQCCNNCKDLNKKLDSVKNNKVINITDQFVVLSEVVELNSNNVLIIGHNNPIVICVNYSGLEIYKSNKLTN